EMMSRALTTSKTELPESASSTNHPVPSPLAVSGTRPSLRLAESTLRPPARLCCKWYLQLCQYQLRVCPDRAISMVHRWISASCSKSSWNASLPVSLRIIRLKEFRVDGSLKSICPFSKQGWFSCCWVQSYH